MKWIISTAVILGIIWVITRSRRRLPPLEEILKRIHQGELDGLDNFLPVNPADGFLETDKSFWMLSKGRKGLKRRKENAVCWVQACQVLHLNSEMPREDLGYMTTRSLLISFFTRCDVVESFFRLFIRSLPHVCARIATYLYWEMERRAQILNLTFGIGHWIT